MKTRFLTLVITAAIILSICGCHNHSHDIVGYWTLSSMQGSTVTVNSNSSILYSYDVNTGVFKQINGPNDTTLYTAMFQLNIKNDGSYIDSEAMIQTGHPAFVDSYTDSWTYSPDDLGGGTFTMNGLYQTSFAQGYLIGLFNYNPQFKVTRLDDHHLQLTNNWAYTRTSPNASSITNSFVLNFTK